MENSELYTIESTNNDLIAAGPSTVNSTGFRARFDTKRPEIEEIALTSTNSGENPDDFPNSRLVRNGDTLTLSFETTERISTKNDLEGSRKPSVSFFNGSEELSVSDANITLQTSDLTGTQWQAILPIDNTLTSLQDKEGYLGFKITVLDKVGNQRVIEFEDDQQDKSETSLAQKIPAGEGAYETQNPSNYRVRFDTKLPEVESIRMVSSNQGSNSDYNTDVSKSLLLRDNDTVSLEFITSERISTELDLLGLRKPEVYFISDTTELPADNISLQSTDVNGRNWIARLKIDESEPSLSDKEGYLGFKVKVLDKSGNERIIEFSDDETSLTQTLPVAPVTQTTNTSGDRARMDTKHPEVTIVALTSSNSGANTEEFPDTRLVRDGDTLTLSFETSERISLES
ncbi:MAG: hypothetical protein QF675_10500, partial [SAR324 cluster bacterium]|nr:hypothetical protein [SAR324 cluster bacterium]